MTAIFAPTASHHKRESIQSEAKPGVQHISEILPLVLERLGALESAPEEADLVEAASEELEPCLVGQS